MLGLQYKPVHGIIDYHCWPYSKYVSVDIPDYKITKPLDYYDSWPDYWYIYTPLKPFRRYLNNLLLRDLRTMLETRWDPIQGYDYTYWPDSKYFKNYRFSPPINFDDPWSYRSRVWFPYYWSTRRLFQHYIDYKPSDVSIRDVRNMIYINYPYRTIDYYPESTRVYRPLTCYYNYYYPIRSLNYYSDVWPYYPYYRYLYYKYTLPSDRYYHLKGKIIYRPDPAFDVTYRLYPTASYVRNKIYKPLGLYCDYYEPIRSLYWNSSYWPLYRSVGSFVDDLPSRQGTRLQKIFDSETSLIRAQTSALLKRVHDPVPRAQRFIWPTVRHYHDYDLSPSLYSSSNSVQRILTSSPSSKSSYTTYYTAPERKYIGTGRLSSVSYAGGRAYDRRPHIYLYDNPLQSDIQLLSYYINKFKQEKTYSADSSKASAILPLSPARATRKFGSKRSTEEDAKQDAEMQKLREARAARLAFINEEEKHERLSASREVDEAVKAKKEKEDATRLAEERALAEEQARQQALIKEAARKAELARQEELAAQAAAQRAADLERQAELAKKEEAKKQAEIDKKKKEDAEEKARLEEQKRLEEAKAEEALQAQLRLEEIARKAEEEREDELARQAEELAELARQEAELAEQAKHEAEAEEERRQEAELEDLRRQEAELAELERQEQELADAAKQEAEVAERAKEDAEAARLEAEQAEADAQQAELEELERAQAELDALEEEAKAIESEPAQEEEPQVDEAELARQAELEELRRQEEELEELEKAQAELDALEEEAKAMASDFGPPVDHNDEEEDDEAIAEGAQSEEGED